jgi:hypothetical protein
MAKGSPTWGSQPTRYYSGGEAQRQRRGRKLYFVNGAVRNAALHRGLAPLSDRGEMGLLLENLAASAGIAEHARIPYP